jgi:hypothetical protein
VRLSFTPLDSRDLLSSVLVAAEGVVYADGTTIRPFEDYDGPLSVARIDESRIVVGAGEGGGPRVAVIDLVTGDREADYFAFETTFLGGVRVAAEEDRVYVGAGPGGGPVVAEFDYVGRELGRAFYGDPSFRGGVYVDGRGDFRRPQITIGDGPIVVYVDLPQFTTRELSSIVRNTATQFGVLLDVLQFTTVLPNLSLKEYVTVRPAELDFNTTTSLGVAHNTLFARKRQPLVIGIDPSATAEEVGQLVLPHELGHFLGLRHVPDPGSIMFEHQGRLDLSFSASELSSMRAYAEAGLRL